MTSLSQQILEHYQIRKSTKQKLAFIDLLRSHIPELTIQEGGWPKSRNLIIGDPETAKVLLTAHYDTCAWLPFPNFITPKNPLLSILYSLVLIVQMVAIIFVLELVLHTLAADFWLLYWSSLIIWFGLLALMIFGPANKHTANDNTSGVITLCEIYAALSDDERDHVALVFFDNEEPGLIGSSYFRKIYKKQMKGKLLINFDCVSDGSNILLAVSKAARKDYSAAVSSSFMSTAKKQILVEKAERVYYPSDQAGFQKSIAVAALKHKKILGYYMDRIHTHKDTIFDEQNIHFLRDCVLKFLKAI